jgi:hypothetical protein
MDADLDADIDSDKPSKMRKPSWRGRPSRSHLKRIIESRGLVIRTRQREAPEPRKSVIQWLLDSDPSIRWQVMRDLMDRVRRGRCR